MLNLELRKSFRGAPVGAPRLFGRHFGSRMSIEEAERKANTEPGLPPQTRSLTEIRKEITTLIKSNAVDMVQKTINQVDEGHYAAMKYLFEAIGLFRERMREGGPAEDRRAAAYRLGLC